MRAIDRRPETQPEERTPEQLRGDMARLLAQATDLAVLLDQRKLDARQGRGYFTNTARAEMDALMAAEKKSQMKADPTIAGLNVSSQDSGLRSGPTKAPGNLRAIAADVELATKLVDVSRRVLTQLFSDVGPGDFAQHLVPLVAHLDDAGFLVDLNDELRDAIEVAGAAVYGETQTGIDAPCPWCHRQTLVMYWARPTNSVERDYAICDRDPRGHLHPCVCRNDPLCTCKVQPVTFRHTWVNRPGENGRNTLGWLSTRLEFNRLAPTKGTTP